MYKLLHFLFKWDYIYYNTGITDGISKVRVTKDGRIVYKPFSLVNTFYEIKIPSEVMWLTCKPEKYFPKKSIEAEKAEIEARMKKDVKRLKEVKELV